MLQPRLSCDEFHFNRILKILESCGSGSLLHGDLKDIGFLFLSANSLFDHQGAIEMLTSLYRQINPLGFNSSSKVTRQ